MGLLIILAVMLVLAILGLCIDWRYWRRLIGPRFRWWRDLGCHLGLQDEIDDNELRYRARVQDVDLNISAKASDYIDEPDEYMDRLINEGRVREAMQYRIEMVNLAKFRRDPDMLRNYAIYGERIHERWAEVDSQKHLDIISYSEKGLDDVPIGEKAIRFKRRAQAEAEGRRMPPLWTRKPATVANPPVMEALISEESTEPPKTRLLKKRFLEFRSLPLPRPPLSKPKPENGSEGE